MIDRSNSNTANKIRAHTQTTQNVSTNQSQIHTTTHIIAANNNKVHQPTTHPLIPLEHSTHTHNSANFYQHSHMHTPIQVTNNQTQNNFYETLRAYTQRLKEERDISLSYLKRINQLSEELRKKDAQLAKVNKNNKQLVQKLSVYESVLTKSRIRTGPLRMSSVIDKNNMMESIIEYMPPQQVIGHQSPTFKNQNKRSSPPPSQNQSPKNNHQKIGRIFQKPKSPIVLRKTSAIQQQNSINSARNHNRNSRSPSHRRSNQDKPSHSQNKSQAQFKPLVQQARQVKQKQNYQLFQQFFMVSPGQQGQIIYHYKYNKSDNKTQDCIKVYVNHPQFVLKPYQGNPVKTGNKRILFVADSPFTSMKKQSRQFIPMIQNVNPSYYYFGFCILQKQLMNMNGKYFWVPMVYGFISYYPLAEHFLKLTENIARDFPNFKDMRKLEDSLSSFNSVLNNIVTKQKVVELPAQLKYTFFSKQQTLVLPLAQQLPSIMLSYSKDIFKNYAVQLIIDVLMLLLLEIPITVVSQDPQLLAKFMLYFVCLIKPLKYPFPIVFSLPISMQILFQSPFPTFLGCTDSEMVDKYMSQRAVFDLDKKLAKSWPILQHLDTSREYFMDLISKKGCGHNIEKCNIIEILLNGKNVKQIENYWKDFSHTQIYQIFSCQNGTNSNFQ